MNFDSNSHLRFEPTQCAPIFALACEFLTIPMSARARLPVADQGVFRAHDAQVFTPGANRGLFPLASAIRTPKICTGVARDKSGGGAKSPGCWLRPRHQCKTFLEQRLSRY